MSRRRHRGVKTKKMRRSHRQHDDAVVWHIRRHVHIMAPRGIIIRARQDERRHHDAIPAPWPVGVQLRKKTSPPCWRTVGDAWLVAATPRLQFSYGRARRSISSLLRSTFFLERGGREERRREKRSRGFSSTNVYLFLNRSTILQSGREALFNTTRHTRTHTREPRVVIRPLPPLRRRPPR